MERRLLIKPLALGVLTLFLLWVGWIAFLTARQPSAPVRAQQNTEFLTTFVVCCESSNHRLPTVEEGLSVLVKKPANAGPEWIKLLDRPLLDSWGHEYQYRPVLGRFAGFEVFSLGPDGIESADDIRPPPQGDSLAMRPSERLQRR